jgi:hypothetical protein
MRGLLVVLALVTTVTALAMDITVPKWIDDARAVRAELKKSHAELFREVSAILYRLDPIGIGEGTGSPPDEYDAEAGTIIPRLRECRAATDVQRVVFEEFVRWFGTDSRRQVRVLFRRGCRNLERMGCLYSAIAV